MGLLGAASPAPLARGFGERCELPSGVWGGTPTTQRFSTFLALMMLIVDYHAAIGAIGGQDPRASRLAYATGLGAAVSACLDVMFSTVPWLAHPR